MSGVANIETEKTNFTIERAEAVLPQCFSAACRALGTTASASPAHWPLVKISAGNVNSPLDVKRTLLNAGPAILPLIS